MKWRGSLLLVAVLALNFLVEDAEAWKWNTRNKRGADKPNVRHTWDGSGVAATCGGTYNLFMTGPLTIKAGTEEFCNYTLLGDRKCQEIVLHCSNVAIDGEAPDCESTYFEVADGWGGNYRICGEEKFTDKGLTASKGARDLFVNIAGHEGGNVECEAQCTNAAEAEPLPREVKQKKFDNRCVCGLQNQDDRIVGGEDAVKFEFPWQTAVVDYGSRTPFCGASLINDRWVLCATHCFWFADTGPSELQVLFHAHTLSATFTGEVDKDAELGKKGSIRGSGWDAQNFTDEDERTIRVDVSEIIMHPLFHEDYDYDVALLRLAQPVDLSTIEATPICLPILDENGDDFVNANAKVVGWGMPDENAASSTRTLQKLDVPVMSNQECQKEMTDEYAITERMICAGFQQGKQDACTGDSGGPLIVKQPTKQFVQVGVVSWGVGCAQENRPGIYARVTDLSDWIHYHVRKSNPIWCMDTTDGTEPA